MNTLYYCHRCLEVFSLSENKNECAKCFSEFIEEVQEEDEIQEDGGNFAEPESSGLEQILSSQTERPVLEPSTFEPIISNSCPPLGLSSSTNNYNNWVPFESSPSSNSHVKEDAFVQTPSNELRKNSTDISHISKLSVSTESTTKFKEQTNYVPSNILEQTMDGDYKNYEFSSHFLSSNAPKPQSLPQYSSNRSQSQMPPKPPSLPEYSSNRSQSQIPPKPPSVPEVLSIHIQPLIPSEPEKRTRWPGLFRVRNKDDKLFNKISLPSINFTIREDCSICLKTYDTKDSVRITQCGHQYHDECLRAWLKIKRECPICRSQFKV